MFFTTPSNTTPWNYQHTTNLTAQCAVSTTFQSTNHRNDEKHIGRFPGEAPGNQHPARTIAHSPPGVKDILSDLFRDKKNKFSIK